jgi:hypothetical protein
MQQLPVALPVPSASAHSLFSLSLPLVRLISIRREPVKSDQAWFFQVIVLVPQDRQCTRIGRDMVSVIPQDQRRVENTSVIYDEL